MFLTNDDLAPFAEIADDKADAMIEDAEAQATLVAPCITELSEPADAVKCAAVRSILRGAVLRWDEAGAGAITTEQTAGGPFQHMTVTNTSKPRRGLFWPSEIEALQAICKAENDQAEAYMLDMTGLSGTENPLYGAVINTWPGFEPQGTWAD